MSFNYFFAIFSMNTGKVGIATLEILGINFKSTSKGILIFTLDQGKENTDKKNKCKMVEIKTVLIKS
ncbi:MAG: hypothetical protein LWW90_06915 [Candidatus Desulfofervidus auxilii]|nr:hypothetical protein [Candidatus Desulfofervidus auxilii]